MNFLERLLDGAAVEWKTLGEVFQMRAGQHISASKIMQTVNDEYIYPCFGGNGVRGFVNKNSHDGAHLLIGRQGALCGNVQRMKGKFYATEHAVVVTASEQVNIDWAFHLLTIMNLNQYASQSAQPGLAVGKLQGLKIPIPPLKVQAEIVRILDTFTALSAELSAELSDRKKQYNYYRDRLLTFGNEVPVVQLSHCCISIADGDHQAPPKTDTGIPFITISNISNSYQIDFINTKFVSEAYYSELDDKRKARKNDILYTVVGSFGIPVFIDDNRKFAFQRHIAILRPNGNVIISKYLYHVLRSSVFLNQAYAVAVGAAQKTITLAALNRMKVSVPCLKEQARIVAILDKFDTLTHSISEGLPREIALRQKQYEYYRDLLLTFPPL